MLIYRYKARSKRKDQKIKDQCRNPGIKRFIPGNGAKECRRPNAHLGLTWKKSSIHWVCPWGQVVSRELSLKNSTPPSRPTPSEAKGGGP